MINWIEATSPFSCFINFMRCSFNFCCQFVFIVGLRQDVQLVIMIIIKYTSWQNGLLRKWISTNFHKFHMLTIFSLCRGPPLNESHDITLFSFYHKDSSYHILKEMAVKSEKDKCVFLFTHRAVNGCWPNTAVRYTCDKTT